MKKLKLNLDQLHNECDVINKSDLNTIKGGDWITDFFNSHPQGTYTSADWGTPSAPTVATGGSSFDINAFSNLVFHSGGTAAGTVDYSNSNDSEMMMFTFAQDDSDDQVSGYGGYYYSSNYGDYSSNYGEYGGYSSSSNDGMSAPPMYAMSDSDHNTFLSSYFASNGGGPGPGSGGSHAATGVAIGMDSFGVAMTKANMIKFLSSGSKIGGKAFKVITGSGTVIGAIAGGGPAIYNIVNDLYTHKATNSKDWVAAGFAGLGLLSEFTGLGEAWDGTVGFGIAAGTIIYDVADVAHEH